MSTSAVVVAKSPDSRRDAVLAHTLGLVLGTLGFLLSCFAAVVQTFTPTAPSVVINSTSERVGLKSTASGVEPRIVSGTAAVSGTSSGTTTSGRMSQTKSDARRKHQRGVSVDSATVLAVSQSLASDIDRTQTSSSNSRSKTRPTLPHHSHTSPYPSEKQTPGGAQAPPRIRLLSAPEVPQTLQEKETIPPLPRTFSSLAMLENAFRPQSEQTSKLRDFITGRRSRSSLSPRSSPRSSLFELPTTIAEKNSTSQPKASKSDKASKDLRKSKSASRSRLLRPSTAPSDPVSSVPEPSAPESTSRRLLTPPTSSLKRTSTDLSISSKPKLFSSQTLLSPSHCPPKPSAKSRPPPPVRSRTQPYAYPYFFPAPGSAEAEAYVQTVSAERHYKLPGGDLPSTPKSATVASR